MSVSAVSHACHAKEAETQGRQRDARACIRPLGSALCPTPATQKRRGPRDARGTPGGLASNPLAAHIVPRLPNKRGGDQGRQRDARAYIRSVSSAHCPTPATQKRRKGRQRDTRAYVRPLGSAHCPTPATQKRRRPTNARGTPGRTSNPWQCTLSHACHAKEAETQDARGTPGRTSDPLAVHIVPRLQRKRDGDPGAPEGRQGVHPTPWQCTLSHACHAKEAETQGRQRDARAYIRPLGSALCPTPATQKSGDPGTPEGRQEGLHPTPWQRRLSHACHAKETETQGGRTSNPLPAHLVPRLPGKRGGDQGRQRDARAYIRSVSSAHCPTPATQKRRKGRQRDARAYVRPLGSAHCPTPATQKRRRPRDARGTPGRTSNPWQCTLSHACHAKEAETQDARGTPGRTSDPLAVQIVPRLPRKRDGDPGRTYIQPLASAPCPTPARQKRRRPGTPEGRQGVHPIR